MQNWHVLKKDEYGNKYDIRILFRDNKLLIDDVGYIPKGKRKPQFLGAKLTDDYGWRVLAWEGRREAVKKEILKVVPKHLLLEALTETWTQLQPTEIEFN
jgi:hypothetical protein